MALLGPPRCTLPVPRFQGDGCGQAAYHLREVFTVRRCTHLRDSRFLSFHSGGPPVSRGFCFPTINTSTYPEEVSLG